MFEDVNLSDTSSNLSDDLIDIPVRREKCAICTRCLDCNIYEFGIYSIVSGFIFPPIWLIAVIIGYLYNVPNAGRISHVYWTNFVLFIAFIVISVVLMSVYLPDVHNNFTYYHS
jgi:hypothetical protein